MPRRETPKLMHSAQRPSRVSPHYFTTGRKIRPNVLSEILDSTKSPFRIPADIDKAECIRRFQEEQKNERQRNRRGGFMKNQNYSSRLKLNLSERLYVTDDKALPGMSMTDDIDQDFYSLVTGRKIKVDKRLGEYLEDIRKCFFTKLRMGYYDDEVFKAEEEYSWERGQYEKIRQKFEVYLKCFEEFLKADHSSSLELLKTAEKEKKKSEEKKAMAAELADNLRKLKAELLILEEKWTTYRSYQKFLYHISPSDWRKEHDSDFQIQNESERPKESDRGFKSLNGDDLLEKISNFVADKTRSRPPALYFQSHEQLQRIFHELETNNLIALTYSENFKEPIQRMFSELQKVKTQCEKVQRMMEEDILFLRASVEAAEAKAEALRNEAKEVAYGMCKNFVADEGVLAIMALIEDAYEDAIAPNDYELTMVDMVKEIEIKYEKLLLALDKYHYDILVPTIKDFYKTEKITDKEAQVAERKVHQMETLLKRLSKSLIYPKKGPQKVTTRRLIHRSEPRKEELKEFEQVRVFTEEEKEFEYFFGKTCRNVGEAGLYRPLCSIPGTIFPQLSDS